jgi:[protein-PII] uridylyltransferase
MVARLGDGPVEVAYAEQSAFTEVVVCTRDQRHLLANICGVLAVNDINILRADVHTRNDGVVLDVFQVVDVGGSPVLPEWKKERLGVRLGEVIGGRTRVNDLFERYSAQWDRRKTAQSPHTRMPEVQFENQVSDKFTVVDTDVQDDVGLLYRITHALGELDLDIHMAIINTVVNRAQDAFYVVNAGGEKIVNYEILEQIRERLMADLAS